MNHPTAKKLRQLRPIKKGDKKIIHGWVMYDWSNSVYNLTIGSTIFPIYYNTVTKANGTDVVHFFGIPIINTVLYSWSTAFIYLLVALISPLMSSIADYTGRRKAFMMFFTFIGAIGCAGLYFFYGPNIEWGIICFSLGALGYCGSIVFYNSFLPVIAEPKDQDRVSARGYSFGYLGSVLLLIVNLVFVLFPHYFGITDKTFPARLAFLTVCFWWLGFSQFTFSRLPKYTFGQRRKGGDVMFKGYQELRKVFNYIINSKTLSIYLIAYFFIIMAILTVMIMAASFGAKEIGLDEKTMIPSILLIQLVGILGAWLFARLSAKIGNLKALIIVITCWIFTLIGAYLITGAVSFFIVAFFVGFVMGGSQSLARSTYSKMLPETKDHTSFFSFFDVMEKLATVGGLFIFGYIEALTGSMRNSIISLVLFFIIGLILLLVLLKYYKQPITKMESSSNANE
jgi:MFS transporter, UMF1 family